MNEKHRFLRALAAMHLFAASRLVGPLFRPKALRVVIDRVQADGVSPG